MKVLVSTTKTQGARNNDFCFVPEGEILHFGSECDGESVDGGCGCRRSLGGIDCHKATTTMKVVEMELTPSGLADKMFEYLRSAGWVSDDNPRTRRWAQQEADAVIEVAEYFEVGDILERRGRNFRKRGRVNE
jgi:hypothetical protein